MSAIAFLDSKLNTITITTYLAVFWVPISLKIVKKILNYLHKTNENPQKTKDLFGISSQQMPFC